MPDDVMIQCENLTKRFGDFTAVDHVSFPVEKRSIFGFLGPNGSGKSTVIRMLCGILEPSKGAGRIAGHDVSRETDAIKGSLGYMLQKFSLYDEFAGVIGQINRAAEFTLRNVQTVEDRVRQVFGVKVRLPSDTVGLRAGMSVDVSVPDMPPMPK